ncbi:hypothetical protein, partial [Rhodococcus sp. NPDC058514]
INFRTGIGADGMSVDTILDSGLFRMTPAGDSVEAVDTTGAVAGILPLTFTVAGTDYLLIPSIGNDGRALSLTPEIVPQVDPVGTEAAGRTRDQAALNAYIQAQIGWAAGGWMGASMGAAIGAAVLCVLIPVVGCVPGAMIGTVVGGYMGIAAVNPNFQPAVDEFLDTF